MLPTARALVICVRASWAFSWASRKEAACWPIRSELPGSPPSRGLVRGPGAGEGAQRSDSNAKLKGQNKTKKTKKGLLNGNGLPLLGWVKPIIWTVSSSGRCSGCCWTHILLVYVTSWSSLAGENRAGKGNKAQKIKQDQSR